MAEHSAHEPPGLPQNIVDEAADTPMWVPIMGLVILGVVALLFSYRMMTAEPAEAPATEEAPAAEQAAPEAAPEAAPSAPSAAHGE